MSPLSNLPSVERLLQTGAAASILERFGRTLTLNAIRETLEEARVSLKSEAESPAPRDETILDRAEALLSAWMKPSLEPVINATGVILHTNLGRAPLSQETIQAMQEIAVGYSSLEIDLATGKRGQRFLHAESSLRRLTGAESALVVNNNASAVLLVLAALAGSKRVIVARSQLVEIGGGFRMPDVMRQSGAKLVEVGTTNRVRLADYEEQFSTGALVLRVHRSNFKMVGFTGEPEFSDVAAAAHQAGLIVVDDIGSGALLDTAKYGMAHEPTVQESLAAGADVVCFSGDKLLGGPQAGILIGKSSLLARMGKHPLARAVRADKACLAGLIATLDHYLRGEAENKIPVWKMISMPAAEIQARARLWSEDLSAGQVIESESTLGGGSLPGETLPSYALALKVRSANEFMKNLRAQTPPILARTEKERILLDPRTVLMDEDRKLVGSLRTLLREGK